MSHHALIGNPAPAFALPDANGATYTLTPGEGGLPIALFFYPKAGSFGCTKEACAFRDAVADQDIFGPSKVRVIGVGPDPVDKQKAFVEKNKLTYPVLSDEKGVARKAYSTGKGLMGLIEARVTFIIDGKGVVRDTLDSTLNFGAHTKFVQTWLTKLEKEKSGGPVAEPTSEIPEGGLAPSNFGHAN